MVATHCGVGSAQFFGRAFERFVGQHGERAAHTDIVSVFQHLAQTAYKLLRAFVLHRIIMMHIEPDEQAVTAAHSQVFYNFVYLLDGSVVIEVVEVGCEVHTAQRLCGSEVYIVGQGSEAALAVKIGFKHKSSEGGVCGALVGGYNICAVGLDGYCVAVIFEAAVDGKGNGVISVVGQSELSEAQDS